MIEERLRLSDLIDFYGAMLTDKQRRCLEMYLFEDWSYSEIGEEMEISRQAVYDIIHRSSQLLAGYEEKLGFIERYNKATGVIREVHNRLSNLEASKNSVEIDALLELVEPFSNNREV